jgi:N-acetylmuramoyl-L-alanine amidase
MKRGAAISAMFFVAILLLGVKRPNGLADVVEVRHWSYADYTRVVVETTKAVDVQTSVQHLAADPRAERPERLYVDLGGLWVGRRYLDGIELGDGLLQGVRLGQNTLQTTRLVLDLEHYERHRLFTLEHPNRVVIDVYGHRRRSRRGVPEADLPTGQRPVHTVVIDPGHGGRDPGAIGIRGAREKNITLKIAKALGAKLAKRGFDVRYTRRADRTISLEERTAIAEAARADLFVSIARENGITRDQVDDLQRTLARLRVSELSTHSHRLANLVQTELVGGLPSRYRVNDLGVKKGPFYVLFLSDTPAILVEAGFLTNRVEAKRLRDDDYIDALASQMAVGLARYRDGAATMARRGAL